MIRGLQMASSRLNWAAIAEPPQAVWDRFDVFCFVKHPAPELMEELRRWGKTVVLDVVDGWRQPEEDSLCPDKEAAVRLFRKKWEGLAVDFRIYPCAAMKEDLGNEFPGEVHYHHYRPTLQPKPLRERPLTIAYEGEERFLGGWRALLEREAQELGMEFVINPPDMSEADIGFAVRGEGYDGFLASRYKSNVKLANFLGAGLPCVVSSRQASYRETGPRGVVYFDSETELRSGLRSLIPLERRREIRASFLEAREKYSLRHNATKLESLFRKGRIE